MGFILANEVNIIKTSNKNHNQLAKNLNYVIY